MTSTITCIMCDIVQLFGRAGRDGGLSRPHLSEKESGYMFVYIEIKDLCDKKENCLRKRILKAIGATAPVDSSSSLCNFLITVVFQIIIVT